MIQNVFYYLRRLWWAFFAAGTPMTTCIVLLNITVFVLQLVWTHHYHSTWLTDTFALSSHWASSHQYWQVITYAWFHGETLPFALGFPLDRLPLHLFFNMMIVFLVGREIEWVLGLWRFGALYLVGCIGAALSWLYFDNPPGDAVLIGASGAAFALITAFASIDPRRPIYVWVVFIFPLKLTILTVAILLVGSEFMMLHFNLSPEIGHTAHLGGAAAGWLLVKYWQVQPGNKYPIDGPVTRL